MYVGDYGKEMKTTTIWWRLRQDYSTYAINEQ